MAKRVAAAARTIGIISAETTGDDAAGAMTGRESRPPGDPDELREWLARELDLHLPDRPLVEGHCSPLDYLVHVFFEGKWARAADGGWSEQMPEGERTADCVVWANRGGGKTYLGAVATLLDLLFKVNVQVRILAGSLEQSRRMHAYLMSLTERPNIARLLEAKITTRSVRVSNGACAEVLAASQTSVRGTRVQKLRCDEVELFSRELWEAAQLVTRSMAPCKGPWGDCVRGSIEALSTMHVPCGLMWELVGAVGGVGGAGSAGDAEAQTEQAEQGGREGPPVRRRPVFRWGVVDALARCEPDRECGVCPLWGECGGRAKDPSRKPGHIRIDDAIAMKSRVDRATWENEMLCLRPRARNAVYPEFEPSIHVLSSDDPRLASRRVVAWYAGMDFGVRAESVVLLASEDEAGVLVVEHEVVATDQPVVAQREVLRRWVDSGLTRLSDSVLDVKESRGGVCWVAIDPAGFSRSDQTGETNAAILGEAGWRVTGARAEVAVGLRLVRQRLAPADVGRGPTLFIHRRCGRLIECMQRYRYSEKNPESAKPEKGEFDHACDALRYLVASMDRGKGVKLEWY